MSNIIDRMSLIAAIYAVAAGSAYLKRRAYKGAPTHSTDAKKKRKAERAARRINRK